MTLRRTSSFDSLAFAQDDPERSRGTFAQGHSELAERGEL